MKKQIATSLACFALLVFTVPNLPLIKTTSGYQTAGTDNGRIRHCPKGKRYDTRQQTCVREG